MLFYLCSHSLPFSIGSAGLGDATFFIENRYFLSVTCVLFIICYYYLLRLWSVFSFHFISISCRYSFRVHRWWRVSWLVLSLLCLASHCSRLKCLMGKSSLSVLSLVSFSVWLIGFSKSAFTFTLSSLPVWCVSAAT